jgi:hypothetical protein
VNGARSDQRTVTCIYCGSTKKIVDAKGPGRQSRFGLSQLAAPVDGRMIWVTGAIYPDAVLLQNVHIPDLSQSVRVSDH